MSNRSEGPPFIPYADGHEAFALRFAHVERLSTRIRKYNWELAPHRHRDLYQLLYVADGAGEVAFDLQSLEIRAPALVLVPPLVVHKFAFLARSRAFLLTVAESYFTELIALLDRANAAGRLRRTGVIALAPGSAPQQQVDLAYRVLEEQMSSDVRRRGPLFSGSLLTVLGAALEGLDRDGAAPIGSRTHQLYERFRQLVEDHYAERWPVAAYAEVLGTTERTLHRASWSVAGVPPLKIIHRRIALEAQRRLLYSADSVAEIGYSLGFDDPAHFSRFFTDNVGESPAAFRRRRMG